MDLKDKLTEKEIYDKIDEWFNEKPQRPIAQLIIDIIKPLGAIRESAEEETDKYINDILADCDLWKEKLKQLLTAERAERKEVN